LLERMLQISLTTGHLNVWGGVNQKRSITKLTGHWGGPIRRLKSPTEITELTRRPSNLVDPY